MMMVTMVMMVMMVAVILMLMAVPMYLFVITSDSPCLHCSPPHPNVLCHVRNWRMTRCLEGGGGVAQGGFVLELASKHASSREFEEHASSLEFDFELKACWNASVNGVFVCGCVVLLQSRDASKYTSRTGTRATVE